MNKELIRKLYYDIRENYNVDLLSYIPLTSKSYKIITKDNNKLISNYNSEGEYTVSLSRQDKHYGSHLSGWTLHSSLSILDYSY